MSTPERILASKTYKNESNLFKKISSRMNIRSYTMIAALILIWIFFDVKNTEFLTSRNLTNLFEQMSVTSILAIGMVLIIVAGQIDLSVGSLVGLLGGIAAILTNPQWHQTSTIAAILGTITVGVILGALQGWLVAYQMIPSFIVTLGGMMVYRGLLMGITKSNSIPVADSNILGLGNQFFNHSVGIFAVFLAIAITVYTTIHRRISRKKYGFEVAPLIMDVLKVVIYSVVILAFVLTMNNYKGIPLPISFVIIVGLIFSFISTKTTFGRHVYAIGGNAEAARLSGINIKFKTLMLFVLMGLLAAISALLLTARLGTSTPQAGLNYELDAIAACVIGGTSLMGGVGTIGGSIIGSLVMASLDNGMSLLNMDDFWQYIVKGGVLVLAVWLDIASRRRKKA